MPVSRLTYAIGDVHGRADLLRPLLAFIASDAERRGQEPRVIFLGDIVDRGPDSRGAMDLVGRTLKRRPSSRLLPGRNDRVADRACEGFNPTWAWRTWRAAGAPLPTPVTSSACRNGSTAPMRGHRKRTFVTWARKNGKYAAVPKPLPASIRVGIV
jgi:Calcineurin-like phosphoesterase